MSGISKSTIEELYYDKEELDKRAFKEVAYNMGHDKGVIEGLEQGLSQGIEKGLFQGKLSTMKNMLDNNCDKDFIMKMLNLSEKEFCENIKCLQNNKN